MSPKALLAGLVLVSSSVCTSAPERISTARRAPVLPSELAGCYALLDRSNQPAAGSLYFAPSHVRLTLDDWRPRDPAPEPVSAWVAVRLDSTLRPLEDQDHEGMGASRWSWGATPDSVVLLFHTGFSGTELTLAIAPGQRDTLRGHAKEMWDFGPPFVTDGGPAMAVRTPCS
ncbi:MAG TPA: hypothetical protein VF746_15605 [Longimicrobium sp.]